MSTQQIGKSSWLVELSEGVPQIPLMKGWKLELGRDDEFQIVNRDQDGNLLYFRIIKGPYSPVIEEDPANAFSLGVNSYVNAKGDPVAPAMKVKGIICKDASGVGSKVLYRGNLTNFFGKDQGKIEEDGKFVEVGGARYQLYRLVAENKNRLLGYIGFYLPATTHDGSPVEVLEVEDLA